jgi:hypothetical protein
MRDKPRPQGLIVSLPTRAVKLPIISIMSLRCYNGVGTLLRRKSGRCHVAPLACRRHPAPAHPSH